MTARGSPGLVALLVIGAGAMAAAAASAEPLMCQARGSYSSQPPPVEASFHAYSAAGAPGYTYHWDFGDGASSEEQSPTHTYSDQGVYEAVLTVTDGGVPPGLCRDTVTVFAGVVIDPTCLASADTRWGEAPLGVQLGAQPGLIFDPGPYSWSWRFGDGGGSASQNPSHEYGTSGTYWAVATIHSATHSYDCYPTIRLSAIPGVVGIEPAARAWDLRLEQARPNPFRVMTSLGFQLARPGSARLVIRDAGGRLVATLIDGERSAGPQVAVWQGRADGGQPAPPGLYFAVLKQGGVVRSVRFVKLR